MKAEHIQPPISHPSVRQEILEACLRLEAMGYLYATYGNVSVRVPEGFIITPTKVPYRTLKPEDLVLISLKGKVLEGSRLPSSEMHAHWRIYLARPEIGAIAHTHSLNATAVSSIHLDIPVLAEEQSHLVGGEIRCTEYVLGVDHMGLAEEIVSVLGDRNAVLMANHGTLSCGRTLEEALVTCQVVERAAYMYLHVRAAGKPVPLPPEYVAIERDDFLYKYGRPPEGCNLPEAATSVAGR
jgi:L-fuculose-phosphate aldolase